MSMFNAFRRFMPGAACVVSLAAGTTTAVAQAKQDGSAGVRVGELIAVTDTGFERMHAAPAEFLRVG